MLFSTLCLLLAPFANSEAVNYVLVEQDSTGQAAEEYCRNTYPIYDGHLAGIDSQEENDKVAALCVDTVDKRDGCLIGLTTANLGQWADGDATTYTNWAPGQPGDEASNVNYPDVVIRPGNARQGGGLWRPARDIGFPFICQKDVTIRVHETDFIISQFGDRLLPNQQLFTGEALVSENRRFVVALQGDGNLVVYDLADGWGQATWANHVYGTEQRYLVLQGSDGNIVIYSVGGGAVWATHDYNNNPGFLIMQNDGNLVAYDASGAAYWDTWGYSPTYQAFLMYYYDPSTQQMIQNSMSFIVTLIGAVTCLLLVCVYRIKRGRDTKELEPLMDTSGSYATFA